MAQSSSKKKVEYEWVDVTPNEVPRTIHDWQGFIAAVRRAYDYPFYKMSIKYDGEELDVSIRVPVGQEAKMIKWANVDPPVKGDK